MIKLTRPDGSSLLVNPDLIETIEETPDTVVTMTNGKKLLVREGAAVVAARFLDYQRGVRDPGRLAHHGPGGHHEHDGADPADEIDPSGGATPDARP